MASGRENSIYIGGVSDPSILLFDLSQKMYKT
jgi:hypothetical protein